MISVALESIVCLDDLADKTVADHIGFVEVYHRNAVNILEYPLGYAETGLLSARKVDLSRVAGNDTLGAGSDTGKEHLELRCGSVLRLIEQDE